MRGSFNWQLRRLIQTVSRRNKRAVFAHSQRSCCIAVILEQSRTMRSRQNTSSAQCLATIKQLHKIIPSAPASNGLCNATAMDAGKLGLPVHPQYGRFRLSLHGSWRSFACTLKPHHSRA